MANDRGEVTITEIMAALNITRYTALLALKDLNIKGHSPWNDRRKVEYPPGTIEKVREWLERNVPQS